MVVEINKTIGRFNLLLSVMVIGITKIFISASLKHSISSVLYLEVWNDTPNICPSWPKQDPAVSDPVAYSLPSISAGFINPFTIYVCNIY